MHCRRVVARYGEWVQNCLPLPLVEAILLAIPGFYSAPPQLRRHGNYSLTFRPTGLRRGMWRVQLHQDALLIELNVSTCRGQRGVREARERARSWCRTKIRFSRGIRESYRVFQKKLRVSLFVSVALSAFVPRLAKLKDTENIFVNLASNQKKPIILETNTQNVTEP